MEVFRKIWNLSDEATPRLIEILRNATYTLIEAGGTMLDIEPLLTEVDSRERGVEWRDVYGDDQLRTSAHCDETHPQEETPVRPPGLGASLLRISRSLSRLVTRQRRRRI